VYDDIRNTIVEIMKAGRDIYHAMTPPSKKTLKELGLGGGNNG
jgi:hypothetical protein